MTERQEREAVAESGARVRAADILARRLPSVPDKPATMAVPAGNAASGVTGQGASTSAKAQPNGADKPATATVTKSGGRAAAVPVVGSGDATSPSGARSATIAGQPVNGEVLKKVVQKPAPGDSATNSETGSAAGSNGAGSGMALNGPSTGTSNSTSNTTSNSARTLRQNRQRRSPSLRARRPISPLQPKIIPTSRAHHLHI